MIDKTIRILLKVILTHLSFIKLLKRNNIRIFGIYELYNTIEEVDQLIEAVTQVRARFAPSGRRRRRANQD